MSRTELIFFSQTFISYVAHSQLLSQFQHLTGLFDVLCPCHFHCHCTQIQVLDAFVTFYPIVSPIIIIGSLSVAQVRPLQT